MRSRIGVLLIAVMFLAACGGGTAEITSVAAGDDRPESFEDLDIQSPLGDFLGQDFTSFGGNDDQQAEMQEMEREAGRLTAACMREKGFEYTPPEAGRFENFSGPGGDIPYFSDEWVAKYGFGVTTQRFPQSMVGGDLVGFPDEQFARGDEGEFVDPNQSYVEGLSEGEREAYQEALWGEPPDFGPEGPSEDFEFEPSGCQNEAFETAFSEGFGNLDDFFQTFGDELEALQERAESDPRAIEFNEKVASCVSSSGMAWVDMQDLYERFESRLNSLQETAFAQDPFEAAGLDSDEMSEEEVQDVLDDMNRLSPEAQETLGALQAEELALAKVVTECGGGPLNEAAVLGDLRAEYEQQFLDSNAAALEPYKAE